MRAAWYERPGGAAEVLQVGDLPTPEPAPGEVRVRVSYSGVNPGDIKKRTAWLGEGALPFPRVVPHSDGAGVVDAVGEGVDPARVGTRVWVHGAQSYRAFGTAAEFTCIPAEQAVPLPEGVSDQVGACLGIPGITAHRAIHADGPVAGRMVLVHGVLGAVGSMAAQLALRAGATVVGTVRRSGEVGEVDLSGLAAVVALDEPDVADHVLDLAPGGVERIAEVDLAGNLLLDQKVLTLGGTIAAYGSSSPALQLDFWPLLFNNVVIRLLGSDDFPAASKVAAAEELTAAVADGSLVVRMGSPFALADIAQAHDRVDAGSRARVLLAL